jgi:DNA polymerase/3'-5' exonuclease PolX
MDRLKRDVILPIAERVYEELAPHCDRIAVAGSLRRMTETSKDIEIVCVPKPFDWGLMADGFCAAVEKYKKIKGTVTGNCRYTQRETPEGVKVDIFIAKPENWGYILSIRTGSADFSKHLAYSWNKQGYYGEKGFLRSKESHEIVPVYEEKDLFDLAKVSYIAPWKR